MKVSLTLHECQPTTYNDGDNIVIPLGGEEALYIRSYTSLALIFI